MRLELAFFANAAEVRPDGTMYVLCGGIDFVKGPKYPGVHPGFALIARFNANVDECGKNHEVTVTIRCPNGDKHDVVQKISLNAPKNQIHPDRGNVTTACFNYWSFSFPEEGEYVFSFHLADTEIGRVALDAIVDAAPSPGASRRTRKTTRTSKRRTKR